MKPHRSLALSIILLWLVLSLAIPTRAVTAQTNIVYVRLGGHQFPSLCDSWAAACELAYALNDVADGGERNELWVAEGTYKPTGDGRFATFHLRSGIALYGGFAGTETAREQRDVASHPTILSGDIGTPDDPSDNAYHVVTGSGTTSTAVLDGFTVTGGYANGEDYPHERGGGMSNISGSPTLAHVTFSGNSAELLGGGMYNDGGSPTLAHVTFHGNSAGYHGGGMLNDISSPTLTDVTFSSNSAGFYGGGMVNASCSPTLTHVTFSGNSAGESGGGMFNDASNPTLTNVTFHGNSASYGGGGGMVNYFYSDPTLTNVTFHGNSADVGGGMFNEYHSNPVARNAIFWGNTAPAGPQVFNESDSPTSLSDSIVQGGCPAGTTCTGVVDADPLLGPLGDWGGGTPTLPLLPGSPAIDAGDSAVCPASDARGVTRPQGTGCDIGAFESQGFTLAVSGGSGQITPPGTPFALPLNLRVSSAHGEPVDGGVVTFQAPASGPSASPSPSSVTIAGGTAALSLTANGIMGSYLVTADTSGAIEPAVFGLMNALSTTTTLDSSANPSVYGQDLTLTAVVSGEGETTPSGTVAFTSNGAEIPGCEAVPLVEGRAECSLAPLPLGLHELRAAYSGDAVHASSFATFTQDVNPAATTTTLASSANPSLAGQGLTLTVTVFPTAPGSGTPTGTVELFEVEAPSGLAPASQSLFPPQPLQEGTASFSLPTLPPGGHALRASYSGDTHFQASISVIFTQVVEAYTVYLPLLPGGS